MSWLNKNKKMLISVALIVLAALLVLRSGIITLETFEMLADFPIWLTILGFIAVYAIMGLTMAVPKSLLYIAAGIAFPAWIGISVTYAGLALAATIGHAMGRRMGEDKVSKLIAKNKKVSDFLMGNKENLLSLSFIGRVIPLPFVLTSLFFGALKTPFFRFILFSLLGATPYMIPVVFAGSAITDPFSSAFLVPFGISFGVTALTFVIYKAREILRPYIIGFFVIAQIYLIANIFSRVFILIPIVAAASYLVGIFIVLHLIKKDKATAYKVIWIVVILAIPIIGGILYLFFGNSRPVQKVANHIKEHAVIAKILDSDDASPYEQWGVDGRMVGAMQYIRRLTSYHSYANTKTTYYPMGELMFEDMLAELIKAEKFIFMEYFIISKSQMWDRIVEILLQKAENGVDVRLIFDDVGSLGLFNATYMSNLRAKGIKIMRFNPIVPTISPFMNRRNHRKILVIDGHTGFNGGINIGDEYINLNSPLGIWKDTGVVLKGDAVWSFTLMFIETWNAFSKQDDERINDFSTYRDVNDNVCEAGLTSNGLIIPYGDTPLGNERLGENIYIDILNQAQRYVYIFTPYLIISEKMIYAMQMAAKRGVDVRVVNPGIPDKKIVYRLTRSYYKYLLDAGVKIYEYTPGFLHAKSFVCDDEVAVVGTINLDYRSLYLHFECATLLYKSSTIADIKEDAIKTITESQEVFPKKNRFYNEMIDSVLHLFAPLM